MMAWLRTVRARRRASSSSVRSAGRVGAVGADVMAGCGSGLSRRPGPQWGPAVDGWGLLEQGVDRGGGGLDRGFGGFAAGGGLADLLGDRVLHLLLTLDDRRQDGGVEGVEDGL